MEWVFSAGHSFVHTHRNKRTKPSPLHRPRWTRRPKRRYHTTETSNTATHYPRKPTRAAGRRSSETSQKASQPANHRNKLKRGPPKLPSRIDTHPTHPPYVQPHTHTHIHTDHPVTSAAAFSSDHAGTASACGEPHAPDAPHAHDDASWWGRGPTPHPAVATHPPLAAKGHPAAATRAWGRAPDAP